MKGLIIIAALSAVTLSACAPVQPLSQYSPVVDMNHVNQAKFDKDLQACRDIALKVQADYKARQQKQLGEHLLAGILVGALTGAALGSNSRYQGNYAAAGAMYGAAAGAATNDYSYDLVKFGPRRIVDRCMNNRGYQILNDVGRG